MNDKWFLPVAAVLAFGVIIMAICGGSGIEKQRIYEKCLANNGTMVYNDAVQYCKEIVK